MEKPAEKITTNQPDFFQQLSTRESVLASKNAPDLNIEAELMGAVSYALREAKRGGLSREHIVERMNLCLPDIEKAITKRKLDCWCAASKEHTPFPLKFLPAFIWAVRGVVSPLEVVTRSLGLSLVDEDEQLAASLGKTLLQEVELKKQKRLLQDKLGGAS